MLSPTRPPYFARRCMHAALLLIAITAVACGSISPVNNGDSDAVPTAGIAAPAGTPDATATASPVATTLPTTTPNATSSALSPAADGPSPLPRSSPTTEELTERALAHVRVLSEGLPPRVSGTDGELAAAGYVAEELRSYGYAVQFQEFMARSRPRNGEHLEVTSPRNTSGPLSIRTNIFTGSGEGDVTGPLVFVGLGREGDLAGFSLAGTVALVERGVIPFRTKAENVFGAGAEGMVVFNDVPGIFDGTLGRGFDREFDRPAVTISGEDGEALVATLENEQVNVRLRLVSEERPSRNVVASRPGSGDSIVIIGGHYDAVPGTPGAGDNASGTATFLVIAEELADAGLPFELRVIGFGSEELGLLGSAAYIASLDEEEKSRIVAMFNYDALGAGELEIGGHFRLADRALEVASEIGTPAVRGIEIPGASSDHASFRDAGIPSMFFFGSDFSLIHSPLDTVDAMAPEMMGQAAAITLNGLLDGLADGLGE